jgi:hypothetical protein
MEDRRSGLVEDPSRSSQVLRLAGPTLIPLGQDG